MKVTLPCGWLLFECLDRIDLECGNVICIETSSQSAYWLSKRHPEGIYIPHTVVLLDKADGRSRKRLENFAFVFGMTHVIVEEPFDLVVEAFLCFLQSLSADVWPDLRLIGDTALEFGS
jgi:hypothetical protein